MRNLLLFVFSLAVLIHSVNAQNDYKLIRTKLPMSNTEKDYYVKQVGAHYVLNGDIIVGNAGQTLMLYQNNSSDGYIWPKGSVPVKIDLSMKNKKTLNNASMHDNAIEAIDVLNKYTNIRLTAHINQRDYIRIMYSADTGYGGVSPVGRKGGEQIVYITRDSDIETIIHELMHSLGFWHEQSRYDRDRYVVIDTNNARLGSRYNFQIEPGTPTSSYDYASIMHYSAYAFAINKSKPTIRCKDENNNISDCSIGNKRGYLSEKDIAGINTSYFYNRELPTINYMSTLPYDDAPMAQRVQTGSALEGIQSQQRVIDKPLPDGVYMIKVMSTGKFLDIKDISNANGAALQQWDRGGSENQKFAVTTLGNKTFLLKAMNSGKYLNVSGQSTQEQAPIIQWDYVDQANLKFIISYNSSRKGYTIQGMQSSMYWCVNSESNGEKIIQRSPIMDYFEFERVRNIPNENMTQKIITNSRPTNHIIRKGNQ